MVWRGAGVGGAGVGVCGGWFFEGVADGRAVDGEAAEFRGDQVGPGASEGVEPADVPGLRGGVVGAEVFAENDEVAGGRGHAVFVGDGVAVEDEAALPGYVECLPVAGCGFYFCEAFPVADEEGESGEGRGGVRVELAESLRHGSVLREGQWRLRATEKKGQGGEEHGASRWARGEVVRQWLHWFVG